MPTNEIYSGSHSDEVQVNCPSLRVPRLLSVEVYLMRSGTAIKVMFMHIRLLIIQYAGDYREVVRRFSADKDETYYSCFWTGEGHLNSGSH